MLKGEERAEGIRSYAELVERKTEADLYWATVRDSGEMFRDELPHLCRRAAEHIEAVAPNDRYRQLLAAHLRAAADLLREDFRREQMAPEDRYREMLTRHAEEAAALLEAVGEKQDLLSEGKLGVPVRSMP